MESLAHCQRGYLPLPIEIKAFRFDRSLPERGLVLGGLLSHALYGFVISVLHGGYRGCPCAFTAFGTMVTEMKCTPFAQVGLGINCNPASALPHFFPCPHGVFCMQASSKCLKGASGNNRF